jgi:hypothetical protein
VGSAQEGRGRSAVAFLGRRARLLRRTWRPTGAPLRPVSVRLRPLLSRRPLLSATETRDASTPLIYLALSSQL